MKNEVKKNKERKRQFIIDNDPFIVPIKNDVIFAYQ